MLHCSGNTDLILDSENRTKSSRFGNAFLAGGTCPNNLVNELRMHGDVHLIYVSLRTSIECEKKTSFAVHLVLRHDIYKPR